MRSVIIASPYAHRPGHHLSSATALADALVRREIDAEIVTSLPPHGRVPATLSDRVRSAGELSRSLLRRAATRTPVQQHVSFERSLEVLTCMVAAWRLSSSKTKPAFHFVDATYLLLGLWCHLVSARTVYYTTSELSGVGPSVHLKGFARILAWARGAVLRAACRRGRLWVVCETAFVEARVRAVLGDHVSLVPYAITEPTLKLGREEARTRLKIQDDLPILLMFGTHREGKNYDVIFEAAKQLEFRVCLLFVGKLISGNDPRKLGARWGCSGAVYVDNFVTEEAAALYFAAADACVLSYEGDYTKGSGVLLEACRYGIPIIASRTGHLAEFVELYRCGLLFEQGNATDLAEVIHRFTGLEQSEREELQTGLNKAAKDHSWTRLVEYYISMYNLT